MIVDRSLRPQFHGRGAITILADKFRIVPRHIRDVPPGNRNEVALEVRVYDFMDLGVMDSLSTAASAFCICSMAGLLPQYRWKGAG